MALGTMKHNAAKMDDTPAGFPPIITAITAITAAIANCRKQHVSCLIYLYQKLDVFHQENKNILGKKNLSVT